MLLPTHSNDHDLLGILVSSVSAIIVANVNYGYCHHVHLCHWPLWSQLVTPDVVTTQGCLAGGPLGGLDPSFISSVPCGP